MNKVFLLFCLFSTYLNYSQITTVPTEESVNADIYNTSQVQKLPEFPGGMNEFYKFIGLNYKTPYVKGGLNGKVIATFVVEVDGSITDIKILRDIGNGTGEEAIRVLKSSPLWLPGEQDGKKVRVQFAIPLVINTK